MWGRHMQPKRLCGYKVLSAKSEGKAKGLSPFCAITKEQ